MSIAIKTQDQLNTDMLANITDDYEKSTGFLTGDLVKTNAIELAKIYIAIQELVDKIDVDKLSGDELTKYVKQRKGIVRKEATKAKAILTITGTATINTGDLFSTSNNIQFASIETKTITESGTVEVECTQAGSIGMVGANSIILMPITIAGVTSVTNLASSYDGFEAEDDDSLRNRYYEALQTPATSGNIYHYLKWAKEINGVGNAKVFSLWNGDNTVKVLIINADMQPASQTLIDEVQEYIDPKGEGDSMWGTGAGQAPIGAYTTVATATPNSINISVTVTLVDGYTLGTVQTNITNAIVAYLKEIAFYYNYVSYAKIGSIIFNTEGVADYTNLLVNGVATNVNLGDEEVAVIGTVTVS